MLTDYVAAEERIVACPNQDVVYGGGSLGLEQSPVVIQVPDFGDRFWVYQAVDLRTDGFVRLGKMYGTTPGFYLLAGPNWQGEVPEGHHRRSFARSTNTGFIAPRIFMDDTAEDRRAIQPVLRQIMMYPLAEYDGTMKSIDWNTIAKLPNAGDRRAGNRYGFRRSLRRHAAGRSRRCAAAARRGGALRAGAGGPRGREERSEAQGGDDRRRRWRPTSNWSSRCSQFRNYGQQLPHHWSTISNEAAFGTDYFTRTAVAKSNIFVNAPNETKYFYQDLDASGARLNGANRYTVTFAKDQTPPVHGFWSLTLYNEHHFFAPNEINRYSLGTKNKDLQVRARTARSRSTCRPMRRPRRNAPTGCRRRKAATSRSTCAPTGRRRRSPTARGRRRRWCGPSDQMNRGGVAAPRSSGEP